MEAALIHGEAVEVLVRQPQTQVLVTMVTESSIHDWRQAGSPEHLEAAGSSEHLEEGVYSEQHLEAAGYLALPKLVE